MAERRTIVSGRVLRYTGTFSAKELYELIDQWFADQGFSGREEIEHMEKITKNHKQVEIFYQPTKKVSDFAKIELRLLITISELKRRIVELEGRKTNLDEGNLEITFDGYLTTDLEGRFESKPEYYIWRTLVDKFLKKTKNAKYEEMITNYIQELYTHLRKYLRG
jgi:hypothetical protein